MEAVFSEYPDDRSRVGAAFRVLLFLFTFVAILAAFALFAVGGAPMGGFLWFSAFGCIALTEIQVGELRRSSAGAEEATALLSIGFFYAALAWTFDRNGGAFPWSFLFFAAALLAAGAAFRWGMSAFGALSAVCFFATFTSGPGARLAWFVLGAVLAPPLVAASVAPSLAPSQRRACDFALVVVLLALYLSVHLGSYDFWLLERARSFLELDTAAPDLSQRWGRPLFIAATALLPLIVLASGIRWRRPLLLRMGVVLGVASLVTLRFYVHVAPLWVILVLSGGFAIGLGLLLHRFLRSGPSGERRGFTSDPLFGNGSASGVFEVGLSAALAPGTSPSAEPGFRGGGGKFGGGGAGGEY
jgi:hypothetical protein